MNEDLNLLFKNHPLAKDIDGISISFIDFSTLSFEEVTFRSNGKIFSNSRDKIYYDLASVTKPLTIGLIQFLSPDLLQEEHFRLLLNHHSGIPAWGLLSQANWKQQISSYQINNSIAEYSDFGAIRAQIEFEKRTNKNLYHECSKYWDSELIHWLKVDSKLCLKTGERLFRPIVGEVHDPNAWVIKSPVSHAGLFSTISGLSKTLIYLEREFKICDYFIQKFITLKPDRFINAWDTVTNKSTTLAGDLCGDFTVGHLGFTGTSFWIDCQKKKGVVILSNATRDGWYNKSNLNEMRKKISNIFWKKS